LGKDSELEKMKSRPHQGFDWRAKLGPALVSAEQALNHVSSGDRVGIALAQSTSHLRGGHGCAGG
jgi:hypothetical protein